MAVQCCTVIILRLATNLFAAFRYFPVFLRWTQQRTITLSSLRLQRSAPCSTPSRSLHPFHLQFFPFKRQRPSSLTWLVNPCGHQGLHIKPHTATTQPHVPQRPYDEICRTTGTCDIYRSGQHCSCRRTHTHHYMVTRLRHCVLLSANPRYICGLLRN
jgi:hypothetical protein